jgi:TBC1 domain family member 2
MRGGAVGDMARLTPARPSLTPRSNTIKASFTADWAEDDAWDSGSDSESRSKTQQPSPMNARTLSASISAPPTNSFAPTVNPSGTGTQPRPVPRPALNSSSSTLSSSFTHVQAPSPSSYPPRIGGPVADTSSGGGEAGSPPIKNGWTVVRAAGARKADGEDTSGMDEMVVGEGTPDADAPPEGSGYMRLGNPNVNAVRGDVDAIVNGTVSPLWGSPICRHTDLPL